MKFAVVLTPAACFDSDHAKGIIATALMLVASGEHHVELLVPCQPPDLATYVRHLVRENGGRLTFCPYALPPFMHDSKSEDARSLIWSRFLLDQQADVVIVFHNSQAVNLRCISLMPQFLVVLVAVDVVKEGSKREEYGVSPDIVISSACAAQRTRELWNPKDHVFIDISDNDSQQIFRLPDMLTSFTHGNKNLEAVDTPALFGTAVMAELVRQSSELLQFRRTTIINASQRDLAYRALIEGLIKLKRPNSELVNFANAIAFNEGPSVRRQLLLDISVIVHGDARSGIQRVVRSLLLELLCSPPTDMDVRPIHFHSGQYLYANAYAHQLVSGGALPEKDSHVDFRPGDMYLALDLNTHLVEPAKHVFRDMQARGVSLNFMVYDILLVHHPEWWKPGQSEIFHDWLCSIGVLADTLVCISDAVAADLQRWIAKEKLCRYGTPRVESFHLGADVASSLPSTGMPDDAQALLQAIKAAPSFLMVGTIEPRKGHAQALAAFELLWSQNVNCQLVIVGKAGWLMDEFILRLKAHPERGNHLIWLEGISDEFLQGVYHSSICLLAASLGEGFGLPLIEGAQFGLPILARELPVFREVAGTNAFYFNGTEPDTLAMAVKDWLVSYSTGTVPDSRQMSYLSWKQSAVALQLALGLKQKSTFNDPE